MARKKSIRSALKIGQAVAVEHVDLRGTLSTGTQYRDWWVNELHPTQKGFEAMTAKFVAALR